MNKRFLRLKELIQPVIHRVKGYVSRFGGTDLAFAVMLVDMGDIDNEFSQEERRVVSKMLIKMFAYSQEDADELVEKALEIVQSERSDPDTFARQIRDSLEPQQRRELIELLDAVMESDSELHPFEAALKKRYASLLGIKEQ